MGEFDIYCCVCGLPPVGPTYPLEMSEDPAHPEHAAYNAAMAAMDPHLGEFSVLLKDGRAVHGCEVVCGHEFSKDGELFHSIHAGFNSHIKSDKTNRCVFLHTACHQFVERDFGFALEFAHVPVSAVHNCASVKHGAVEKYQAGQFFEFPEMLADDAMWMARSPLADCPRNAARLRRVVAQFKLPLP